MKHPLRKRFWIEAGVATITSILFVITLVWNNWIEMVFNLDPDQGSGTLEWLIVGALLVVTILLLASAGYEWRRTRVAIG